MSRDTASYRMHHCPARCGAMIPHHQYACPTDWRRLDPNLKQAIVDGYRIGPLSVEHIEAMSAARRWYQNNPREHHA
jgi:hypothetical protein